MWCSVDLLESVITKAFVEYGIELNRHSLLLERRTLEECLLTYASVCLSCKAGRNAIRTDAITNRLCVSRSSDFPHAVLLQTLGYRHTFFVSRRPSWWRDGVNLPGLCGQIFRHLLRRANESLGLVFICDVAKDVDYFVRRVGRWDAERQEEALDSAHRTLNCCQPSSGWCRIKTFLGIKSRIKLLFRNLLKSYDLAPQWIIPMDVPHRVALPLGKYYS